VCAFCGNLTTVQAGRELSNSDVDSDTVAVSNLRVWRETHADTEDHLWRMRHGGYGSQWVEVRPELIDMTDRDPVYRRAESLGLTGLTSIVDSLCALGQYPLLDEDDHSEVEREEEAEHWESYGRSDVTQAVEAELEGLAVEMPDTIDDLYWETCHKVGVYPEKIDSSAYDFGSESRWGREPRLIEPLCAALGFPLVTVPEPGTVRDSLPWDLPDRAAIAGVLSDLQIGINEARAACAPHSEVD
jgi:hypothetical protein